jgi:DNA-binding transcriptional LysR family regulator
MVDLNNRRLDIDALRMLSALRRYSGITRTAEHLGLSQSAVSHKIKRLEQSLDCALLTRKSGEPQFTPTGQQLLDYAERILVLHDEALINLTRSELSGRINLGLTEDTTCSDLARILGRFKRLHPNVKVYTKVQMSQSMRLQLEAGELDAAIIQVFAHEVLPSDIVLLRENLFWVKQPELKLDFSAPLPFLAFADNCFYRQWAIESCGEIGLRLETLFECFSFAGVVSALKSGLGLALLSERHIDSAMQIITTGLPSPPKLAYVIRKNRKSRSRALATLIAEIDREVTRTGGLELPN